MPETTALTEQEAPRRHGVPFPALTWVMSGLCVVLTLAHHFSTTAYLPETSLWYRLGHFGHLPATAIWSGQWPALFTTFFIHGDPSRPILTAMHLGFNLLVMVQAGRALEATLHPLAYYLFFVAAAIVGSGAELAISGSTGVGASGVVYAMFGLLWAARHRDPEWAEVANPLAVWLVVGWAVVCVALTRMNVVRIANGAHFGGLLFGLAVGWTFFPRGRRGLRALGAATLVALAALVTLSLTWMPWSPYWTFWKGVQARQQHRFDDAIAWFEKSGGLGIPDWQVQANVAVTQIMRDNPNAVFQSSAVPEEPDIHRFGQPLPQNAQAPPPLNVPPGPGRSPEAP